MERSAPQLSRKRAGWTPETALLLASARLNMLPADMASVERALDRNIDWTVLLSLARYHGLQPLLHRHLVAGRFKSGAVPEAVSARLKESADTIARRNLGLSAALIRILRLFEGAGIKAIPLKGPVLAQLVYGSVGLRKILDIDILVEQGDARRAVELLKDQGYAYQYDTQRLKHIEELLLRTTHDISLRAPDRTYAVEIHHQFLPASGSARYGLESISTQLRRFSFMGVPILGLTWEDLLVYLCEHGAHHTWSRLEWLCGIAELVRQGRIQDWDRVRRCATRFRSLQRTIAGLRLAHELLEAPVPSDMLAADAGIQKANGSVLRRLTDNPRREPTIFEDLLYQLRTDSGHLARFRRCLMMLFMPHISDIQAVSLPRALWPAYYIVRPIRQVLDPFRGRSARRKKVSGK